MPISKTNLIKRLIFLVVMAVLAAAVALINHELRRGANYSLNNDPNPQLTYADDTGGTISAIEEPEALPKIVRLTFGGNCTVGAALGTSSFGTFNHTAAMEGADYFLSALAPILSEDDLTVLGCAAVLSDLELSYNDGDGEEFPYIGSVENGAIFSSGSVELVSLANRRAMVYGRTGTGDTKAVVKQADVAWTDDENAYYFEKSGIRIAILGASSDEDDTIETIVMRATIVSETCDYVVAYVNRDSGREDYYAALARQAIDAGADLVCFTGAPSDSGEIRAETYNNGIIINSLGSLIDGGSFTAPDTALLRITLNVEGDAITRVEGELLPVTYGTHPWIPALK